MTIGELKEGEFAITTEGLGILAMSPRSFRPSKEAEECANVVHLANGIGAFLAHSRCVRATAEQAFAAAREYLGQ